MKKSIDSYKEKYEKLMDILRNEETTFTQFNSAIVNLKNICVTTNGKLDLEKMINVFDDMEVIYQSRDKEQKYFLSHELKNKFEKYLSETNEEIQRLVKDRNTQYQSENPDAKIKKVFLPYNIEETQKKLFDVLNNMIDKIKEIIKNLQNEKNIENIKQHLEDYKNQFYKITYILSLTPTNKLSIPQLNLAMRTIAVEEHKEDLGSIDDENLIKWFDSISIVGGLFINNNNYQRLRDKLKTFKIDLEKTFEDVKNSVINKYKQKNNLENEDIINAYVDFLTSQIYYLKAKLDAFNDIKDTEKSIEINKIYPNDLDIAKKNHLNELNKVNKNNLNEFKQQYYDILNNICLTNDNKLDEEIFKKTLKKMNLIKEKDIESFKISEIDFNEYIDEIIKLKNSLYELIEKFKLKHKNIAGILIGEEILNKNENIENIKKAQKITSNGISKIEKIQENLKNTLEKNMKLQKEIEVLQKNFEIEKSQKAGNKSSIEYLKKIDEIQKEFKNLKPTNSIDEKLETLEKTSSQLLDIKNLAKSKIKNIDNILETLDKLEYEIKPEKNSINTNNEINTTNEKKETAIKDSLNYIFNTLENIPENNLLQNFNDDELNNFDSLMEKVIGKQENDDEKNQNDDTNKNKNEIIINNNSDSEDSKDNENKSK